MSSGRETPRIGGVGRALRATVLSPLRRQTYLNLLYLLLAVPLGGLYIVFLIGGLSLGITLSILLVGIPILLFVLGTSHVFAAFERATARRLLRVEISSPGYPFLEHDGELQRLRALVFGIGTYMAICFLATKFLIGLVSLIVLTTLVATAVALLVTPLYYTRTDVGLVAAAIDLAPFSWLPWHELLAGVAFALAFAESEVSSLPQALAVSMLGIGVLLVSLSVCNTFARLVGQFSRVFLGSFARSSEGDH